MTSASVILSAVATNIVGGAELRGGACQAMPLDEVDTVFCPDSTKGVNFDWTTARATCGGCPIRDACLDDALDYEGNLGHSSRYHFRGGMSPRERALEAKRRAKDEQPEPEPQPEPKCRDRDHCSRGHELTADNLLDSSDGRRRCRTCNRDRDRERRARARAAA